MAITLKEQTAASVSTPASNEDSLYFDSSSGAMKFKDDTGSSFTIPTTAGKLSQFAATTSAELAGVISDETGSGALVFGTSPTIATPTISAPTITGNGVAVTASYGDNDTSIATTAFVQAAIATVVDDGNSGTADTIDFSAGNVHKSTLTGNVTYTFTAPPTGSVVVLKVVQGSGPYTVTWPATVHWPGGTAPTLTATNAKVDIFTFLWDGTTYFGVTSGQNYSA